MQIAEGLPQAERTVAKIQRSDPIRAIFVPVLVGIPILTVTVKKNFSQKAVGSAWNPVCAERLCGRVRAHPDAIAGFRRKRP
jgi:hypothetical protein